MNKNLYSNAMDKIEMSDECLGEILDSLDEVQEKPFKPKKVHYIQIITAAIVLVFGTVTVAATAGNMDWVKNFFKNEETEVLETVYDMVSEVEDFKYESDYGINFTPIGAISDSKEVYFVLSVDNVPDDFDFTNAEMSLTDYKEYLSENWSNILTQVDYNSDENLLICKASSNDDIFESGEYIQFDLYKWKVDDDVYSDISFGKVGFKLSNISDSSIKTIDYSKYSPSDEYNNIFDKITITPLSMNTYGKRDMYKEIPHGEKPFRIVFNNGEEMNYSLSGSYSCDGMYQLENRFEDKPIDPDNITEIYFKDMLIYHKNEEIIPDIYDMVVDIENFECESNFDIKISPVGIICDEQDLYAILHFDELPENLKGEFIDSHIGNVTAISPNLDSLSFSCKTDFDYEKNDIILKLNCTQRLFKDGEEIEMIFDYNEYEDVNGYKEILNLPNIAKISFNISLGEYDSININYKENKPEYIQESEEGFVVDEINVTPLSMLITKEAPYSVNLTEKSPSLKIILTDGTEIISNRDLTASGSDVSYKVIKSFEEPIDIGSISEIYFNDILIYRK